MPNRWGIPKQLEHEIRARDTVCVYCGKAFTSPDFSTRSAASWEHIINDAMLITKENIALCCRGCNASKGQKAVSVWLRSTYCVTRGIDDRTLAEVVKAAIIAGQ